MLQLRHIKISRASLPPVFSIPFPDSDKHFVLENLETLLKVQDLGTTKHVLDKMPNVKKLGIHYNTTIWHVYDVHLQKLETLKIVFDSPTNSTFLRSITSAPRLKKITLECGRIGWEDMTIFGSLPNLEVLKLREFAFIGPVWVPVDGEFPKLKFLHIWETDLEHWRADKTHFPRLEHLILWKCSKLVEIPPCIGEIETLEIIEIDYSSPSVVKSAKDIFNDQQSQGNEGLQVLVHPTKARLIPLKFGLWQDGSGVIRRRKRKLDRRQEASPAVQNVESSQQLATPAVQNVEWSQHGASSAIQNIESSQHGASLAVQNVESSQEWDSPAVQNVESSQLGASSAVQNVESSQEWASSAVQNVESSQEWAFSTVQNVESSQEWDSPAVQNVESSELGASSAVQNVESSQEWDSPAVQNVESSEEWASSAVQTVESSQHGASSAVQNVESSQNPAIASVHSCSTRLRFRPSHHIHKRRSHLHLLPAPNSASNVMRRRNVGICHGCRSTDHFFRDCPIKRQCPWCAHGLQKCFEVERKTKNKGRLFKTCSVNCGYFDWVINEELSGELSTTNEIVNPTAIEEFKDLPRMFDSLAIIAKK